MLRVEANAFTEALFDDQSKVKGKLEAMLSWAGEQARQKEKMEDKEVFRHNRILFLHGVSGVGKTSVYLSVRTATEKEYVWLDCMETAFPQVNVLADLLVLIEEKLNKDGKFELREHGERSETIQQLRELQNRISEIWDGVPAQRAASVGPQAFAAEVLGVSRYRVSLRNKLNSLIDKISKHFFEGKMLILPVDDIHESSNAIEILRLFRFIHSPRLLVLAIGNFELMRKRVEAKEHKESEGVEDDAKTVIAQQSYLRIDKIVPASHRVDLLPPDPINDFDWIKNFPRSMPEGGTLWERFRSIEMDRMSPTMDSWNAEQSRGLWLFKTTPRHLLDMHLKLPQRGTPQPPEEFDVQDFIWRQLEVAISLNGWLHDKELKQLLEVVRTDPNTNKKVMQLELNKDHVNVAWKVRAEDEGLVEYQVKRSNRLERVPLFPTIQAWLRLLVDVVETANRTARQLPQKWLDEKKKLVLTWQDHP